MEKGKVIFTSGNKLKPCVGQVVQYGVIGNNKLRIVSKHGLVHLSVKEVKILDKITLQNVEYKDVRVVYSTNNVHYFQKIS